MRWNSQVVAGWVEPVYLGDANIKLTAKLDTGAKTSSLSAEELTHLVRQQKPWVAFTIHASDGTAFRIEQPVIRIARIRRAGVGVRERPVISLPVCLAGYREQVEFTLTDRSAMNYSVLIGRAFLANRIIVDSEATFTTVQSCQAGK
ncbi:MAG: ATP-dependent zinc protease [Rhizobiales bacterium]|nr:ATP-dependent zinc protease [Hyphomicrobiales bacterium]